MVTETLEFIAKSTDEKILWAVGGSVVLNHHALVENPNDIDIVVDRKDADLMGALLESIGRREELRADGLYATEIFSKYTVNGVGVDLMANMSVNHEEGVYVYRFDGMSVTDFKETGGTKIPLASLEEWYVIYQLLEGRERKVGIIEDHFMKNGIGHRFLIERMLKGNLPERVIKRTEALLGAAG